MSSELTLDEFDGSNCVDRVVSFGGNAAVAGILSYWSKFPDWEILSKLVT